MAERVTVISVDRATEVDLFQRGNTIFFFEGDPATAPLYALEEVVLTKISRRGSFWQEHPQPIAEQLRRRLRQHMTSQRADNQADADPNSAD